MTSEEIRSWSRGVERLQTVLNAQAERRRKPNFFRIAPRLLRKEGVHSDLLAWLLDPQGWHGLGSAFGRHFIGEALESAGCPVRGPFAVTRVHTEFSTGEGPIDVLVDLATGDTSIVVGIENKIDADVGPSQLLRYARGLVMRSAGRNVVLVLLAPTERDDDPGQVSGCKFSPMTYRSVIAALEAALAEQEPTSSSSGVELARHYLEILRMDIVPEPQPETDQILNELYAENRDAWRLIRRRLPSERDENHIALAEAICKRLTEEPPVPWQFALRPDRYVRVFLPGWSNHFGKSERERIVGLPSEAAAVTHYPHAHFRLVADAPEDEGDDRWQYTAKLRLDARANPQLGASIRSALGSRLRDRQRDKDQITPVLEQSSRLPGIVGREVPGRVVEWFAEQILPITRLINGRLGHE